MLNTKRIKKRLTAFFLFCAVVSILASSLTISAAGKEKYISSYMQFARQQQKKTKKKLCYAIINASDGKMPVLLMAYTDSWMKSSGKGAVEAKVYSYSGSKVVYITKMRSTGSSYPLMKKGKYIISGWHHSSQRLMVSGAKGYMESVEGFGIENGKCYKKTWTVVNGKKRKMAKKKISAKKASSLDYYSNFYSNGNIIKFKKVK